MTHHGKWLLMGAAITCGLIAPVTARTVPDPNVQIDNAVKGRTPGTPVNCINLNQISSTEIVRRTAIMYHMNNGTIYVNRPASGAETLSRDNILVTDTHSDQLCSVDIVKLLDSGSRMNVGSVGLGQFVPYPRPAKR